MVFIRWNKEYIPIIFYRDKAIKTHKNIAVQSPTKKNKYTKNNNHKNPTNNTAGQVPVSLSQALQQNIQILNPRINHLMVTINTVFNMLLDGNQVLRAELDKTQRKNKADLRIFTLLKKKGKGS